MNDTVIHLAFVCVCVHACVRACAFVATLEDTHTSARHHGARVSVRGAARCFAAVMLSVWS